MARLTKIETVPFSGTGRSNAPLIRMFWYFVTFGKWGERYHYFHVTMLKYFSVNDNRLTINVSTNTRLFMKAIKGIDAINCRCTLTEVLNERINKKD